MAWAAVSDVTLLPPPKFQPASSCACVGLKSEAADNVVGSADLQRVKLQRWMLRQGNLALAHQHIEGSTRHATREWFHHRGDFIQDAPQDVRHLARVVHNPAGERVWLRATSVFEPADSSHDLTDCRFRGLNLQRALGHDSSLSFASGRPSPVDASNPAKNETAERLVSAGCSFQNLYEELYRRVSNTKND